MECLSIGQSPSFYRKGSEYTFCDDFQSLFSDSADQARTRFAFSRQYDAYGLLPMLKFFILPTIGLRNIVLDVFCPRG